MEHTDSVAQATDGTETGVGSLLVEAVYRFILVVTVALWTVIGLIVWVPLLVRTTTLLAGAVFYATMFRDQGRITNAQRAVHYAVRFYVRGFHHFISFYGQRHEPEPPVGLFEPIVDLKWRELAVECSWIIAVWAAGFYLGHRAFA
jgi:hypothetical protein